MAKLDIEAALFATLPVMDSVKTALFHFVTVHEHFQGQFCDEYCL